jgi:hypothetical protein
LTRTKNGHLDVGPHVVLADEAFLAHAVDLNALEGSVHDFELVQHREHEYPVEAHGQVAEAGAHQGSTLLHFL